MSKADDPLITTVIPTYRRPAMLKRAVASALAQENVPLRVSVFDNASGDETKSVVDELMRNDNRLNYFCHPTNIGGQANFDYAMHRVETPFFSLLSDDDYLLPGFYEAAVRSLETNPEAMFWAGITLLVDEKNWIWDAPVSRWARDGLILPPNGLLAMTRGMAPTWTGIVFRTELLNRIGSLDHEVLGPSDLDFLLRAAATQQFVLEKRPVSVFTLNPDSFSATQPLSMFWPGWQKMFANMRSTDGLDDGLRSEALEALQQDAKHMLFSRGIHALAYQRPGFTRDAVDALGRERRDRLTSLFMRVLLVSCERIPLAMRMFGFLYRGLEALKIRSKCKLHKEYSHLLLDPD